MGKGLVSSIEERGDWATYLMYAVMGGYAVLYVINKIVNYKAGVTKKLT